MKKKVLVIALAVALVAIMVSGSIAYFTAEDKVDNTFTIGSVKIEIYENDEATVDATKELGKLTPIVNVADPSADESYIKKAVDVKNTGLNEAYIRVHIAIPTALVPYLHLDMNTTGWTEQTSTTASVTDAATGESVAYTVYTYDYDSEVAPDAFTTELLKGVYLGSDVDLEENANGDLEFILRDADGNKVAASGVVANTKNANGTYTSAKINVLVASEAIQVQGFTGATAALNSGFGVNTNPWQ